MQVMDEPYFFKVPKVPKVPKVSKVLKVFKVFKKAPFHRKKVTFKV